MSVDYTQKDCSGYKEDWHSSSEHHGDKDCDKNLGVFNVHKEFWTLIQINVILERLRFSKWSIFFIERLISKSFNIPYQSLGSIRNRRHKNIDDLRLNNNITYTDEPSIVKVWIRPSDERLRDESYSLLAKVSIGKHH